MGTDPDAGFALRRRERAFPIQWIAVRAHACQRCYRQQPFHLDAVDAATTRRCCSMARLTGGFPQPLRGGRESRLQALL
jgi:hypothetical protein